MRFMSIIPNFLDTALTPVAKEIGEKLSDAVDILLTPITMAKAVRDHHLQIFLDNLNKEVKSIPEEQLKEPDLNIVYPALENVFKYAHDEKYLQDMYLNLISSAMDKRKEDSIHPSYVKIIEELTPYEVKLLSVQKHRTIHDDTFDTCLHGIKTYSVFTINPNKFELSTSQTTLAINNLTRLNLMELRYTDFFGKREEEKRKYLVEIQEMLERMNDPMASYYSEMIHGFDHHSTRNFNFFQCKITRFGQMFVEACTKNNQG